MSPMVKESEKTNFKPRTFRPRLGDRISFGGIIYIVSENEIKPFSPAKPERVPLELIDAEIDTLDYNEETKDAMKEAARIARDPNATGYHDVKSLIASLRA